MKIYVGTDHNGFNLKKHLINYLKSNGYDVEDDGDIRLDPNDDFPVFASKVVHSMQKSSDHDPRGILICGSGQGMCMAANRFKGIRAALLYDHESARATRNDDDSNVACLAADLRADEATRIVEAWLSTEFAAAPRFKRRLHELDELG